MVGLLVRHKEWRNDSQSYKAYNRYCSFICNLVCSSSIIWFPCWLLETVWYQTCSSLAILERSSSKPGTGSESTSPTGCESPPSPSPTAFHSHHTGSVEQSALQFVGRFNHFNRLQGEGKRMPFLCGCLRNKPLVVAVWIGLAPCPSMEPKPKSIIKS